MAQLRQFCLGFTGPLLAQVRTKYEKGSFWAGFNPFRGLAEVQEYMQDVAPDKLLLAVARGADDVCADFGVREGSRTHEAIGQTVDRARARADELGRPWKALADYVNATIPRATKAAFQSTVNFLAKGALSPADAASHAFRTLFGFAPSVVEVASKATTFFSALEDFVLGVASDVGGVAMPVFADEFHLQGTAEYKEWTSAATRR